MKTIITHDSGFHADDVFAVATLMLALDEDVTVIRTRDKDVIKTGDYVVDVGGVYEPALHRYDHHQIMKPEPRANGIPYAAFGLVWKSFGIAVSGSERVANDVDARLVQAIDAPDNGISLYEVGATGRRPYTISDVVRGFRSTDAESAHGATDTHFLAAADFARGVIERQIEVSEDGIRAADIVQHYYETSKMKKIVVFEREHSLERELITDALSPYPEPMYAVRYMPANDTWQAIALRPAGGKMFDLRKPFPPHWAGKRDDELAAVTGVSDALYCHTDRFIAVAASRGGALRLAELALAHQT